MAHQGLDDLLRNLVLDQMHRERIPECLGRDRADGERDAVTLCSLYRLTYPAAGRVFAPDIPEPCAGGGLCGRKPFPEPLDEGRIGERHGPRRRDRLAAISPSLRCLSVRSTTNGETSGAALSGSSSTKSPRVSGSI